MTLKNIYTLLLFLMIYSCGNAQFGFQYDDSVPVIEGNDTLKNAWGGGLNYPQFSDFDYDFDGDMDLFVFDRSSDNIRVYTQEGVGTNKHYKLAYGAAANFPTDLIYRAALVDYDNDGRKDIFTYSIGGLRVYRNIGDISNGLQWEMVEPVVESVYPTGINPLAISSSDIPAIVDVDMDGDIDVLTFNMMGNRVEYHQNQSIDLYGIPDSLIFELKNECWGKFTENEFNNGLVLNDPNSPCVGGNIPNPERIDMNARGGKHVGSSLLAIDIDNSGVLDLLIGDATYSSLSLVLNGGTDVNQDSPMVSVEYNFPSSSTPIKITLFPAAYFIDVDFDGVKDLIAAPNALNVSYNESSVKFYKNIGSNSAPNFIYASPNFLQREMIEHGTGTVPMLVDLNEDGLKDLIVANYYRFKPIDSKESTIAYYENVGSANQPAYKFVDYDYLNLSAESYGLKSTPTFGDIDNDGDQDMFLAIENGTIVFYENLSVGSGAVWSTPVTNYEDNLGAIISIGQQNNPTLFDLNEDGLLDLIIGKKTGELVYYENIGTLTSPSFELANANLGNVDVSINSPTGYAAPHFVLDNGEIHLFVGSYNGRLHYYDSIQNHLSSGDSFNLISASYLGIDVGDHSSFWVEDINNDGNLNMFVGQDLGGLFLFEANPLSDLGWEESIHQSDVSLYPNPVSQSFTISSSTSIRGYTISDMHGRIIANKSVDTFKEYIDISQLPLGIYVVGIELENGMLINKKLLKR